jgi:hypothetical protein
MERGVMMAAAKHSSLSRNLAIIALRAASAAIVGWMAWEYTGDPNLSLTVVSIALAALPTPDELTSCDDPGCKH